MTKIRRGSCLCGAVSYVARGQMRGIVACHCHQCRKQSGHFYAATNIADANLQVSGAEQVKWYQSSPQARRGFCGNCGSALFWKREGSDVTSVLAGSLDGPTGLSVERHIFTDDKGDYYEIV